MLTALKYFGNIDEIQCNVSTIIFEYFSAMQELCNCNSQFVLQDIFKNLTFAYPVVERTFLEIAYSTVSTNFKGRTVYQVEAICLADPSLARGVRGMGRKYEVDEVDLISCCMWNTKLGLVSHYRQTKVVSPTGA